MIGVALTGLLGRKLRSVLTAFAIVLGVAMVSGTYILTDTINKGFNTIFTESYKNTDAVITGKQAFSTQNSGTGTISFPEGVRGSAEASSTRFGTLKPASDSAQ